jgi:hypothetical protein
MQIDEIQFNNKYYNELGRAGEAAKEKKSSYLRKLKKIIRQTAL